MKFGKLVDFTVSLRADETETVKAYPVLELDAPIQLVVHNDPSVEWPRWFVFEFNTGCRIGHAEKTRTEAVYQALREIERYSHQTRRQSREKTNAESLAATPPP